MRNKIGILGGTFSPIHNAHINIAKSALYDLSLDEVWFVVAGIPPHKENEGNISAFLRLNMCKEALKDNDNLIAKDFECYKDDKSYTYLTLKYLSEKFPNYEFVFLMGEDSMDTFSTWKHPENITKYAKIAVAMRSDSNPYSEEFINKINNFNSLYGSDCALLSTAYNPISSSMLRKMIANREFDKLEKYTPKPVCDYIKEHRVYEKLHQYTSEEINEIREFVKQTQTEKRYIHSLAVADTAASLASYYYYPAQIAYVTGLLHDCAKNYSDEMLLDYCKNNNINVTQSEKEAPYLLHGIVGSHIAKKRFNIDDEMAHAIEVHTRGEKNMGLLDKIIFLSDVIEPNRSRSKSLDLARTMVYKSLDSTIVIMIEDTIEYLKEGNRPIDATTEETLNYYKESELLYGDG